MPLNLDKLNRFLAKYEVDTWGTSNVFPIPKGCDTAVCLQTDIDGWNGMMGNKITSVLMADKIACYVASISPTVEKSQLELHLSTSLEEFLKREKIDQDKERLCLIV
jgi:hypothetical protein